MENVIADFPPQIRILLKFQGSIFQELADTLKVKVILVVGGNISSVKAYFMLKWLFMVSTIKRGLSRHSWLSPCT